MRSGFKRKQGWPFGFPNPVNEVSARVVASGVVLMAGSAIIFRAPLLLVPLTYGFLARVLTGPTLSPLGQLATRVVTPRLPFEARFVAGPPKRFAQGVGLVTTSLASVAYFGFGWDGATYGLLGVLVVAAGLEAFVGLCLGCKMFALLMRAGLISDQVCLDCANIWDRAPQAA